LRWPAPECPRKEARRRSVQQAGRPSRQAR
jgi:hypothetical protein